MWILITIFLVIAAAAGAGNDECTAVLHALVHYASDAIAAIKQALHS